MSIKMVKSCMAGESIFKVGDKVSIAQGLSRYTNKISLNDILNLKLVQIYCDDNNNKSLPSFKGIVETLTGSTVEIDILDLCDSRERSESYNELSNVGYNFKDGSIYSKGYETFDGNWLFYTA